MPLLFGTLLQPESPYDCRITPRSAVHIGDDGVIARVASADSPPHGALGDDECWILPGFIDAHLHVSQWDRRGIDGFSLHRWQQEVAFPAEMRMSDPEFAADLAERFARDVVARGTTTVVAFGSPFPQEVEATFQVFARTGLRAMYGLTLNDLGMPPELTHHPDTALDQSRALAAKWHNAEHGRLRYAFSPRSSTRCSERLMRGAAALADMLKCHIQTHVAESRDEISQVQTRFPDQVDEMDLFGELGILGPRTILAHGLFLNHQQRRDIARAGASVVHCPIANLFRQSGLMDYMGHRSVGVKIALGSSVAGGFEPFMPRVAAEALQVAKAIRVQSSLHRGEAVPTPAEAWWMLSAGGAQAIGLADQVGRLVPGYQGDCLVVRPEKWIADLPTAQQASALLYSLEPRHIEHVFIAGRRVGPGKI